MSLTISVNTTNAMPVGSYLTIQIPTSILLTGSAPTCQVSSSSQPSAITTSNTCTLTSYVIKITNFLQAALSPNSILTVIISSSLKNPITT